MLTPDDAAAFPETLSAPCHDTPTHRYCCCCYRTSHHQHQVRTEQAEAALAQVAAERDAALAEVGRLRAAVMGLSRWDDGAPCFCSLCPETPDDHEPACLPVRAALGASRTVFVGSDETGHSRPMHADELQREVERLTAELGRATKDRDDMLYWGYPRADRPLEGRQP
jgi:hypothetical protein